MRIIFGGTFDPVHEGHIKAALEISSRLDDRDIFFMPCFLPVHKSAAGANAQQRAEMLKLAVQGHDKLKIDMRELMRANPSFTIDSLQEIRLELGPDEPIVLVLGSDAAVKLGSWRQIEQFSNLTHLMLMQRQGHLIEFDYQQLGGWGFRKIYSVDELNQRDSGCILEITPSTPEVSSSEIRQKVQKNISLEGLVSDAVSSFICDNNLYQ